MQRGAFTTGLLLLVLAAPSQAEDDTAKVDYLKAHAIEVRSRDPLDQDFKDLQPLKKLWKDVRIVQLGEESHGDGACFLAKTRLIKFLHKEMGFSVLAFESGLYDCAKAWAALTAPPGGKFDPVEAMKEGVFGIWMQSHEVKPLANYLHKVAHDPKPLELCGFDCQLTGRASSSQLTGDLHSVIGKALPKLAAPKHRAGWDLMVRYLSDQKVTLSDSQRNARLRDLALAATALDGETEAGNMPRRERAWWAQTLRSLSAQLTNTAAARAKPGGGGPELTNARDAQMAKNLIWLADNHYKGQKIIVWAATFHCIRNAPRLKPQRAHIDYTHTVPMGHAVATHFGKACYTLGFTAYEGEIGKPWRAPSRLSNAMNGSFEAWMKDAGHTEAIVDLRKPAQGGEFLRVPFIARPLGYTPMRGEGWHDVLDGLYFQRYMTPSTRSGYTPPAPVQDMRPLLDKSWSNVEAGLSGGNMWAHKWTFSDAFTQWQRHARPTHEEIRAQEAVVRAWLATKGRKEYLEEFAWRTHYVLADMAAARDDKEAEAEALLASMRMFPEKDQPSPVKTSQFQHIANRRAWLLMEEKGFRKALRWFSDELAKNRRFRFAYLDVWENRISEKQMKQLKDAVAKAYKQRKKRFKDLTNEIAGFEAGLR